MELRDVDSTLAPAAGDEQALRAHLPENEDILWSARPIPDHAAWCGLPGPNHAVRMTFLCAGLVALSPFIAGGLYICWVAATSFFDFGRIEVVLGAPLLFTFGLVLAVAPPYLLVRPRLYNRQLARDTWYVLTGPHARALIVRDGAVVDEAVVPLSAIRGVEVRFTRSDGSGDVALIPDPGGVGPANACGELVFLAVPDASAVQARVAEAVAACRGDVAAI